MEITKEIVQKVLDTVDVGLCSGIGKPIPGQMCVEAAVCYALGLPHGDEPGCVSPVLRTLKIGLNDSDWSSNTARAKGMRELAILQLGSRGHLDDRKFVKELALMTIKVIVPVALRAAAKACKDKQHKTRLTVCAELCEKAENLGAAGLAAGDASYASYAASDARDTRFAANDASYAANDASYAAALAARGARGATIYGARGATIYAARVAARVAASDAGVAKDKVLNLFSKEVSKILIKMDVPGVKWLELIKK